VLLFQPSTWNNGGLGGHSSAALEMFEPEDHVSFFISSGVEQVWTIFSARARFGKDEYREARPPWVTLSCVLLL